MERDVASDQAAFRRLRWANLVAGLIAAGQGWIMLAASNDLALPVTATFLVDDPVAAPSGAAPETLIDVPIGPAVAMFLFLAAAEHLAVAVPGVHRWYERRLDRVVNNARWIEYSDSASLMAVLIGLFVGVRDLAAVIALFAAYTAMILFGLLMERQQRPGRADWTAFWFGSLIGAVPWIIILIYLVQPDQVPGFVYAITAVQLVLFTLFAVNMALQYAAVGRWRDYRFGEAGYIVLSLTAKSLLAWIIFANVLRT